MDYAFRYSLSEDDLAEYNVYTAWHAPWMKKTRINYLLRTALYAAIAFAATIIIMQKINPPKHQNILFLLLTSVVVLFFVVTISYNQVPSSLRNKSRKLFKNEENSHMMNESVVEINDQGLIATDKNSRLQLAWTSITRYAVTREYFYLYINSVHALIIPKRLLTSQKEIDELDSFLSQKIPLSSSFRSMGI